MEGLQVTETAIFLRYTDEHFTPFGVPKPRVPIVINAQTMQIVEPPTRWLFDIACRGRTSSSLTWASYGEGVLDWLRVCEANSWDYLKPAEGQLAAYRDHLRRTPKTDGSPYADSFINGRLRRIALFYKWAFDRGVIDFYPFTQDIQVSFRAHRGLLAHVSTGKQSSKLRLTLRVRKRIPKQLSFTSLNAIRRGLCERDRLIVDWAITTGARQDEIRSLNIKQIPNTQRTSENITYVRIWKTKGSIPRDLVVPVSLLDRTLHYIYGERASIVRKVRQAGRSFDDQALWLSERGLRVSSKTVWKHFHRAALNAGISGTFHDLRHTYAIYTLRALQRQREEIGVDPIQVLKHLLGHGSIESTQVYLEAASIDMSAVENVLVEMLEDIDEAA